MKHLFSTLLLSCTFITVTAMDKNNGNPSSMNVIEADSLRIKLPSVKEDDFKAYKEAFPEIDAAGEEEKTVSQALEQDKKEEPQTLNQLAPNKLSFQDYCKEVLETDADNWDIYIQYWMYKTNGNLNKLHPDYRMDLLIEYMEYVLHKKALTTGQQEKTILEAFEEYKLDNYFSTDNISNNYGQLFYIYIDFVKEICSINDEDLKFVGASILNGYYEVIYKEEKTIKKKEHVTKNKKKEHVTKNKKKVHVTKNKKKEHVTNKRKLRIKKQSFSSPVMPI